MVARTHNCIAGIGKRRRRHEDLVNAVATPELSIRNSQLSVSKCKSSFGLVILASETVPSISEHPESRSYGGQDGPVTGDAGLKMVDQYLGMMTERTAVVGDGADGISGLLSRSELKQRPGPVSLGLCADSASDRTTKRWSGKLKQITVS